VSQNSEGLGTFSEFYKFLLMIGIDLGSRGACVRFATWVIAYTDKGSGEKLFYVHKKYSVLHYLVTRVKDNESNSFAFLNSILFTSFSLKAETSLWLKEILLKI